VRTEVPDRGPGASGAAALTESVRSRPPARPPPERPSNPADRRWRCGRPPAGRPISSSPRGPGRFGSRDSCRWRDASREARRGDPTPGAASIREASSPQPDWRTSGRRRHSLPGEPWNSSPRTACCSCDKQQPSAATSNHGGIRSPTWSSPPNRVHPASRFGVRGFSLEILRRTWPAIRLNRWGFSQSRVPVAQNPAPTVRARLPLQQGCGDSTRTEMRPRFCDKVKSVSSAERKEAFAATEAVFPAACRGAGRRDQERAGVGHPNPPEPGRR